MPKPADLYKDFPFVEGPHVVAFQQSGKQAPFIVGPFVSGEEALVYARDSKTPWVIIPLHSPVVD